MPAAAIAGRESSLDEAIEAAAALLRTSRCAVIAGLGTDVAGAEAAVALARQLGGAFDHVHGAAMLADLDVMREGGWIVASGQQARAFADVLMFVGPGLGAAWGQLHPDAAPPLDPDRPRRVIRLCPGRDGELAAPAAQTIAARPADLPVVLAALRARVAGRPVAGLKRLDRQLAGLAETLRGAHYGVAVWSAAALDPLCIEMLCGLIDDLNGTTRFAGLPWAAPDNAAGVAQAAAWRTGFPLRVGFGRGAPEHDPWRFDAARMIEAGEADAAVWVSACSPAAPPWRRAVPTVALVAEGTRFAAAPAVAITVGRPGVDHDGVLFDPRLGVIAARYAADATRKPHVAGVIGRLCDAIGARC
jgi:formylmethanofuran dehydrogenase subunit B